jgi:putative Ca2+/H+ antiporter (TMEM165/GDT1 family)
MSADLPRFAAGDVTLSLTIIASTFGIIFLAELPDKTALAALILAARYRARDVIAGAWLAFLVQTLIAVAAGSVFTLLPATPIRIASGLGFLVFAAVAFFRNEEKEDAEERDAIVKSATQRPVWLVSFLVIFAAEWGDLTQLATAALVAHNRSPLSVGIGATLALWAVTVVAATSGSAIARFVSPRQLNRAGAVLFAGIGLFILYTSLR